MSDLVQRLRAFPDDYTTTLFQDALVAEAANEIERLRAALAAETERCAKVCDEIAMQYKGDGNGHSAERAANAIRALKEKSA